MKKIIIKKELCHLIEQLHYETNALNDLLSFMVKDNVDVDSDNFLKIQKKYMEKYTEYQLAKSNLIKIYNIGNEKWYLNFDNAELVIDEN